MGIPSISSTPKVYPRLNEVLSSKVILVSYGPFIVRKKESIAANDFRNPRRRVSCVLKNVMSDVLTRQTWPKKRGLCCLNEHFEGNGKDVRTGEVDFRQCASHQQPKNTKVGLLSAGVLSCFLAWSTAATGQTAAGFSIDIDDNLLVTLSANNARLLDILREIERQTGVLMTISENIPDKVSLEVSQTSLDRVIQRLAPNHLLVHGRTDDIERRPFIKEILVLSSDPNSQSTGGNFDGNLPTGEPVDEIYSEEPNSQSQIDQQNSELQQPQTQ